MIWDVSTSSWVWPAGTGPTAGLTQGPGTVIDTTTGKPASVTPFESLDAKGRDPRLYGDKAGEEDTAEARRARDQVGAEFTDYQTRTAPQALTPGVTAVAQAPVANVGSAYISTAPTVGKAATVAPVRDVAVAPITATPIAPTERVQAAQIDRPSVATVDPSVGTAVVDRGDQLQFRGDQRDLVSQLQAAAAGTAPSAAEMTGRRINEEAQADALATVGLNHGRGANAAARQAGRTVATLKQNAARDAALARATEQEKARAQLAATLGQGREQDIGLAAKQAEISQQSNVVGAQLGTQVAISNADREAARAMKQADLEQAARMGNAAAENELNRRQAELSTAANTTTEQLRLEAAKSNQQVDLTTGLTNAQAENRMKELQAQLTSQSGIANAEQQNEMVKLQAQLEQQRNITNAQEVNTTARSDAANRLQTDLQNLDAQLKSRGMDDAQRQAYLDAWLKENGQILGADSAYNAVKAGSELNISDFIGPLINGASTAGAAAITASDRRVKKDVAKVSDDAAMRLAEVLGSPSEWTYTGERDDGRRHVGWMAQDLEKDPLGKKFVVTGDDGVKGVDYQGLTAALLAAALRSRKAAR